MKEKSIKFGLMCNGKKLQNWQLNAIKQLLALKNVECSLIIIEKNGEQTFSEKVRDRLKITNIFWLIYLFIVRNKFKAAKKVNFPKWLSHVKRYKCSAVKDREYSKCFNKTDIKKIKAHNLDFILRFSSSTLNGEIFKVAKFGIWTFHHGDEEKYRGGPPCFWEIYNSDSVTGAVLKRSTENANIGIVLKKGYIHTKYSYIENWENLCMETSKWPAQLCVDIKNGQTAKFFSDSVKTSAPVYLEPTNMEFLLFLFRSWLYRLKRVLNILFYVDYWNIGIAKTHISSFLKERKPDIEWFPLNKKEKFIADPFVLSDSCDSNKLHIFFETYPFNEIKGRIDHCLYNEGFTTEIRNILTKGYHLSYPYILKHSDNIYMVPETYGNNNITIYKAADFPYKWEKEATLIENFKGIDTTIINHDGMWWLFTSDKNDGPHHNLQLFYSNDLFSEWTPHPKNPVKTDIRSARCAGTPFVSNGSLIRPSMDYSSKVEGRITLNKILTLSKTEFEEISIKTIEPYEECIFSDKIHTLAAAGDYTVIDGCRECCIFSDINFFKGKMKLLLKAIAS